MVFLNRLSELSFQFHQNYLVPRQIDRTNKVAGSNRLDTSTLLNERVCEWNDLQFVHAQSTDSQTAGRPASGK